MRFLHLNTWGYGSTGNVALCLHRALRSKGHESDMVVADLGPNPEPDVRATRKPTRAALLAKRTLRRFLADHVWNKTEVDYAFLPKWRFSIPSVKDIESRLEGKPDAIILYWIDHFLTDRVIADLSRRFDAPVYWYLMDMAPLTAGCHYAFDCNGFEGMCGHCPAIGSRSEIDLSRRSWLRRHETLSGIDLRVIAASDHARKDAARSSLVKGRPTSTMPISVSPKLFRDGDACEARSKLGIPVDGTVFFFGAQHLKERRKGMPELLEALGIVARSLGTKEPPHLAFAGKKFDLELPFPSTYLGYLDRDKLALAYRAADAFLCPSIQDAGPLMINESIMSGTPVVCFEMGVGPDLVVTGRSGYLARLGDVEDYARGIMSILESDPNSRAEMRRGCEDIAQAKLHPEAQVELLLKIVGSEPKSQSSP